MKTYIVLVVVLLITLVAVLPVAAAWTVTKLCADHNTDVPGWLNYMPPTQFYGQLDGDASLEILLRDREAEYQIYIYDGSTYALEFQYTFPVGMDNANYANMCDTDGDGAQEVIVMTDRSVWLIDSGEPGPVGVLSQNPRSEVSPTISQSRPNPMNSAAQIDYQVGTSGHTTLRIFDVAGRLVRTLVDKDVASGSHTASWDGRNDKDLEVASGTYFYQLDNNGSMSAKKMIVLK
jgi:hypothetical protein